MTTPPALPPPEPEPIDPMRHTDIELNLTHDEFHRLQVALENSLDHALQFVQTETSLPPDQEPDMDSLLDYGLLINRYRALQRLIPPVEPLTMPEGF